MGQVCSNNKYILNINIMKYETIKEFTKSVKKSRSTIYRFYVKRPDLFAETKLENRKRIIPISHQKYFDIEM